jgi:thioredoxin-dependent peroxiredoxin
LIPDALAAALIEKPSRLAARTAITAQWRDGDDVIIAVSVSDEEARQIYPDGWQSPRPYLRIVPQPR